MYVRVRLSVGHNSGVWLGYEKHKCMASLNTSGGLHLHIRIEWTFFLDLNSLLVGVRYVSRY